jgi:hypothetical protein
MRNLEEEMEAKMTSKDVQNKPEARSNMNSSLPRPPGPVCLKLVTQDASGLRFRRSTYGWKYNFIRKPIDVVLRRKPFRINENHQNKQRTESIRVLRHHIWSNEPCIVFEPVRGARPG